MRFATGTRRRVGRPRNSRCAVLTLCFLSPLLAEVLSGSTPPLQFVNPFTMAVLVGFYGSGAVLAREATRRLRLGWLNLLLFGAAFGVLEEGVVVQSWFNPYWPDVLYLHGYGRSFDTLWTWALNLTLYHAVVSIAIPVVLVEALFPELAGIPWLGRRGTIGFGLALTLMSLLLAIALGFAAFRSRGYSHPPAMWFAAMVICGALVWLGVHAKMPRLARRAGAMPGPWRLRLAGLGCTTLFFLIHYGAHTMVPAALEMIASASIVAAACWKVRRWSGGVCWGAPDRVALATGVLLFFVLFAPLVEFGVHPPGKLETGLTLAAAAAAFGLWRLSRRCAKHEWSFA